jgi:uncharacterized protein (TIGR02001 family)
MPANKRELKMSKKIASTLLAGLLVGLPIVAAQAEDEEGWWYAGNVTLTSDYVFRGVSQTDEDPALQSGLEIGHSMGFYAGAWASNVDFDAPDGIDNEVNLYAGWVFAFADESELDVQWVRYIYPGARTGFGINYNELIATYSFVDYFSATVAWTNDFLRTDESAFYYRLGAEVPMGDSEFNLTAGAGYNDISNAAGSDYWDFQLGVYRSWGMFTADLSYFETSGYDRDVQDFLGPRKWADGRVVLSLSVDF